MLDLRAAAALSALPGALGCHLLSAFRARRSSLDAASLTPGEVLVTPVPSAKVAAMADFDIEAELLTLFPEPDAILRAARASQRARRALDEAARAGLTPVPFGHADYPALLALVADPPPMLWVAGHVEVLSRATVAIVGSRAASPLSLEIAFDLGRDLSATLVVASGLARGVDAAAHRGALTAGRTVAVLGSGPDVIYPSEHRMLADAIAADGAIVSEVVPGTPPRREHFPRRNRLISGLSLGVVVVEASPRSGSLITARVALDQGARSWLCPDRRRASAIAALTA